ncbi:dihydrofolate reductase [Tulasnella sp. 424]|nr:dihydrofolate reductase [Tulasnella sp. 424]
MDLTLIVAATISNGIGHSGALPWRLPNEMAYFAKITSKAPERAINAVVMGRKSWESIPPKYRPLKNRLNVVVSRQPEYDIGMPPPTQSSLNSPTSSLAILRPSLASALGSLQDALPSDSTSLHRTFIIGGASIYAEALNLNLSNQESFPFVNRILLTRVLSPSYSECDVFFPDFQALDSRWKRSSHKELEEWAGLQVSEGVQEERGTKYEYQMWTR